MKNRVYGIIGIRSKMSNWNADFSGYPKTTSAGDTFGSDKALKFPYKYKWDKDGEKVLYIKSFKQESKKDGVSIVPRSLKERYEYLFDVADLKKVKDQSEVVKNIFKAVDVKQFGATFAEEGNNIGITGAVQIGQGFNKYVDTIAEEQQILSPFRDGTANEKNKTGEDAKATTLGTKIVSDEAHYVYPFSITPNVYDEYVKLGLTDGYTEEDYARFKEASLTSATCFNTNAKIGCENELSVFVEVEDQTYLPDLSQYVEFKKSTDSSKKDVMILGFDELVNALGDRVKNVEIYYNPYKIELKHTLKKQTTFNIFTREVIK